jgi:hypothetical protein
VCVNLCGPCCSIWDTPATIMSNSAVQMDSGPDPSRNARLRTAFDANCDVNKQAVSHCFEKLRKTLRNSSLAALFVIIQTHFAGAQPIKAKIQHTHHNTYTSCISLSLGERIILRYSLLGSMHARNDAMLIFYARPR